IEIDNLTVCILRALRFYPHWPFIVLMLFRSGNFQLINDIWANLFRDPLQDLALEITQLRTPIGVIAGNVDNAIFNSIRLRMLRDLLTTQLVPMARTPPMSPLIFA